MRAQHLVGLPAVLALSLSRADLLSHSVFAEGGSGAEEDDDDDDDDGNDGNDNDTSINRASCSLVILESTIERECE